MSDLTPCFLNEQRQIIVDFLQQSERRHIALVGPPGSGKTQVGLVLAEALALEAKDLDASISQRQQKTIAELFLSKGEVLFRAQERGVLRDLLANAAPSVIATGGGSWPDAAMQSALNVGAIPIMLDASQQTLLERLSQANQLASRPLLNGPDPKAALAKLWREREQAYAACALHVATDALSVQEVAEAIWQTLYEMAKKHRDDLAKARVPKVVVPSPALTVNTACPVPVYITDQGANTLAARIAQMGDATMKIAVISDTHVACLHAQPVLDALRAFGLTASLHAFAAGEDAKSLKVAYALYDELADAKIGRHDVIVALGGGVVTDVAGFVAATYLRGVPLVMVPTSTLAAIDSSIGGKNGVNTRRGKNLVGTFFMPQFVFIAQPFLATQSKRAHASGLVEALKIAALYDATLFNTMVEMQGQSLAPADPAWLKIIEQALILKAHVVEKDPEDHNGRMALNFGHTIGHAIEKGEDYAMLHGEAVALGMVAEAAWAEEQGLAIGVKTSIVDALAAMNVPTDWRRAKLSVEALHMDKKRSGDAVTLPIVHKLGQVSLKQVALGALKEFVTCEKGQT